MTTISCAASSQVALISGLRLTASSSALATNSSGVTFTPANSGSACSRVRSSIVGVMSSVRNSVTCGALKALPTIAAAVILRTPLIGMRCSRVAGS